MEDMMEIKTAEIKARIDKHAIAALEKERARIEDELLKVKSIHYETTRLERLQHKFRHIPTVIGGAAAIGSGVCFKVGELTWGIILAGVSTLLTPARTLIEQQTKYGAKGQFDKKHWLELLRDLINAIINHFKKG